MLISWLKQLIIICKPLRTSYLLDTVYILILLLLISLLCLWIHVSHWQWRCWSCLCRMLVTGCNIWNRLVVFHKTTLIWLFLTGWFNYYFAVWILWLRLLLLFTFLTHLLWTWEYYMVIGSYCWTLKLPLKCIDNWIITSWYHKLVLTSHSLTTLWVGL
jgi:hypothetical protein